MRLRHYAGGVCYLIEAPDGSRVERRSHRRAASGEFLSDRLVIPWGGREVPVYAEPAGLLPLLATEGHYGLRLLAGPVPAGAGR
jgi:hypothetical protein